MAHGGGYSGAKGRAATRQDRHRAECPDPGQEEGQGGSKPQPAGVHRAIPLDLKLGAVFLPPYSASGAILTFSRGEKPARRAG